MEKYIFFIIIIILVILVISIYYNLKKKESFSNYSQYSKKKILDDCVNNWAKIYPQGNAEEACESNAWITNPKYLCGICGDSEKKPLYAFQPNNDMSLPRLFGCAPSTTNKLGLNWLQDGNSNPLSAILSDKLTCNLQNVGAVGDMYLYVYSDDYNYISLNGTQIINKSGSNTLGVYYLQNIKYGDELSFNLVNVGGPGGMNICYIWNKQLFIMDENGFENCANIIKYKANGTTGWSNEWIGYITNPLPWMKNWLTCPNGSSSATLTFIVGDFANQKTLNNDLVGFVGIDDYGSVYHNNVSVFTKPEPWTNVMQFTIPNVSFMDSLEVQCTNAGGPGGICLTYLWSGQLFTIPNNLEGFNKTSNIITYTSTNLNTITYPPNGSNGNLQFVTNWINACSGQCNFTLSALIGYNPWIYQSTNNAWYTIVPNNDVCTWADLPIISNRYMTISYWLNLSTLYTANWRNIFRLTSGNADCCTSGDRIAGSWVYPGGTDLSLVDDLENMPSQWYLTVQDIQFNTPTFISIVWNGRDVTSYVNGALQNTISYPYDIISAIPETILYIGDPFYPQDGGVQICNFEINNFSLSASHINEIYNSQNSSLPPVPPPIPPDTSIKCGAYNFCTNVKNSIPYCYGNTNGCLWGANDCNSDSDCSKYNSSTSLQYNDPGPINCSQYSIADGNDWQVNACQLGGIKY